MAKLMLVEDDNNLREIYEARLQAEGYEIVSARDGEEALVVAKAEKPELIISDVMMPKISGFEMLDILRNTEGLKDVKVIMLTALGQSDDQKRANRLGADRYLIKSQVTLEDIVKSTHELLDNPDAAAAPAPPPAAAPAMPPTPPPPVAPEPAEPPAAAPIPEPAAAPAPPPPVAEPPQAQAEPPPVLVADDTTQQTEANETANMEAKIEDFVAGATEDATTPPAAESTTPELIQTPVPQPAAVPDAAVPPTPPPPVAPEPAEPPTLPPTPAPTPAPAVVPVPPPPVAEPPQAQATTPQVAAPAASPAPIAATSVLSTPPATPEPEETPKVESESVTMAHKKVIEPPVTTPKKGIDELLADEAAREAGATPATPPPVVVGDNNPAPTSDGSQIDPHSIAL
jgi:CheY-like chemotaxis protein